MSDRKGFVPRDHYAEVTAKIITMLEQGTVPWRRPWDPGKASSFGPINAATGRHYRGINVLMLGASPKAFDTGDPRWVSYEQAKAKGWQVRGGERGTPVYFFKRVEVDGEPDPDGQVETRTVPVIRAYTVFHASQVDGIPSYVAPTLEKAPWREPEAVRAILDASGVPIKVGGDRAFYSPATDHIQMPVAQAFRSPEGWATTALHELAHASGHPSRLNRNLSGRFGSRAYAAEELIAEMASAFLGAELGVGSELEQHASYIDSWLDLLRDDKKAIFTAAGQAQRAADAILDLHPEYRRARDLADMPAASDDSDKMPKSTNHDADAAFDGLPEHVRRAIDEGGEIPVLVADAGDPAYRYSGPRI